MKRAFLEVDLDALEKLRELNDKLDAIIYSPYDVRGGTLTGLHIELDRFLEDAKTAKN